MKIIKNENKKILDYKEYLLNSEIILKSQQRFKSETHELYSEETNKTALSSNDNKRLQTVNRITSYHYDTTLEKYVKQGC